jgi:hypothetical protein
LNSRKNDNSKLIKLIKDLYIEEKTHREYVEKEIKKLEDERKKK